ncbi:ABC transporter ATP-binding protein [Spirochaeta africana]|uniref:Oligopeptide/dipeptide ABC transporter, ATP-binding protein n=1 Tax=Spirochaeta africana (strain ATCC 700263 / DSM 8902 / Z-7692) TaxID=889378 RepID=H9UKS6_SPIAZ|nr:ABC transporter ATP-binding protein [Spirochaeta africana]AFG38119.1 oligopeptide/dipeptide ABC transporter, ATP-binding protein [Spirochaeta africana DSM 8902]
MSTILEIRSLQTSFNTEKGKVRAVDNVSFDIQAGEVVGLVGESGCGKTAVSLSILRLLPEPPASIDGGSILFEGTDLLTMKGEQLRRIRGNDIAMIFQEPMTSLNPVYTIGNQLMESIQLHQGLDQKAARARAIEMLRLVGIPRADEVVDEYPHRFSGGMRQRAMIAMALSCDPKLLIADEPTTALDVTIQAQILELMRDLKDRIGTAILFITHDLSVIAEMADHVVVMYAGKMMEKADVHTLFRDPQHPYTQGLIRSRPTIEKEQSRLMYIPGNVPNPLEMPGGCPFHPRCPHAMQVCVHSMPGRTELGKDHSVRCWLHHEGLTKPEKRKLRVADTGEGVREE